MPPPPKFSLQGRALADLGGQLQAERDKVARAEGEREAWTETAREMANGLEFYRDIVRQAGEQLGPEAYISDDGSVQDAVLALKVPELVVALRERAERAEGDRDNLRRTLRAVLPLVLEAIRDGKLPPGLEQRMVEWAMRPHPLKTQEQCRKDGHGRTECVDCGAELVPVETVRDPQRIAQLMEDTVEPEGTGPVS